jgi:hypothetical protein
VFTTTLHWFVFSARWIQSISPHSISLKLISILSSHLRLVLPSRFYPCGFPNKILHVFLLSPIQISILWRIDPLLGNALKTHATNYTGAVFSVVSAASVVRQRAIHVAINTGAVFSLDHATICCFVTQFLQQERCFLSGPCHSHCWVTCQWTRILTRDIFSVREVSNLRH